jgi:arginine N-succinyltransferase
MNALLWQLRQADSADLATIAHWLRSEVSAATQPGETVLIAARADDPAAHAQATLRLVPQIGLKLPRVSFHVGCTVHAAPELALFHRQRTLQLGHDHTGAAELADIACAPRLDERSAESALLALVLAALDRIATRPQAFGPTLVVELPGPRNADGSAPFWQGLGRHFYAGDVAAAAAEHGPAWRCHVAALLPRQAVNTAFLPDSAQAAIGVVDEGALWQLRALASAGLRDSHHVNVEDGGPVLEMPLPAAAAASRGP